MNTNNKNMLNTCINEKPFCLYHPIKIIFLDQHSDFLENLNLKFENQLNVSIATSLQSILKKIDQNHFDAIHTIFRYESTINDDNLFPYFVNFETFNALNLIYDKKRFDQIAILVVDSYMLEIKEELAQKPQGTKIFTIMLFTGNDEIKAMKAVNSGLVDKIISKTSNNLYSAILQAVYEFTQRYFKELVWNAVHSLHPAIKMLFSNNAYQQLFAEVIYRSKAIEYYLVDHSGSILFLDKDANPTWLIVKRNEELNEQEGFLMDYDFPEDLLGLVVRREKILFLFSEEDYKKHVDEWVEYLFDAQQLDEDYYYSVVQDRITDSIDWGRVISYSAYVAQ